jgi:ABC-type nickel/cobalt efflux system permease component RcnA
MFNRRKKQIKFFSIFCIIIFLGLFHNVTAYSGLVPCGNGVADVCTLCYLIVGIKGVIDFGSGIIIITAITGITIAGVMYVISGANPALAKKAKDFIEAVVIGVALFLGAWLIVNIIMTTLAKTDLGIQKTDWHTFTCGTESSTVTTYSAGDIPYATPVTAGDLKFQTDKIKAQFGDASDDLKKVLSCLHSKINTFTINSISDNNGGGASCYQNFSNQCEKDSDTKCCHHERTSCHYGGTNSSCTGKSYAVDVSEVNDAMTSAARECGAKVKEEGNHTHISIPGNCGCDSGLK